jgi:hypothetical protein
MNSLAWAGDLGKRVVATLNDGSYGAFVREDAKWVREVHIWGSSFVCIGAVLLGVVTLTGQVGRARQQRRGRTLAVAFIQI